MNYSSLAQMLAQMPPPEGWAKRVFPMPPYDPFARDDIFRAPAAPGTKTLDFDAMGYSEPEWQRQYLQPNNPPLDLGRRLQSWEVQK